MTSPTTDALSIPFGLPPTGPGGFLAMSALAAVLRAETPLRLRPVELPSYAALFEAVDRGVCAAAWSPPLVAMDLVSCGAATPLVVLTRDEGPVYHGAIVAKSGSEVRGANDLRGKRIGWVARESAAGYVAPRLQLRSLGLDPETLFAEERFFGSHAACGRALRGGEVDAIATFASFDEKKGSLVARDVPEAKILLAAGPIPADVVLARTSVPAYVKEALTRALLDLSENTALCRLLRIASFQPATAAHFEPLRRLRNRATAQPFRRLLPCA